MTRAAATLAYHWPTVMFPVLGSRKLPWVIADSCSSAHCLVTDLSPHVPERSDVEDVDEDTPAKMTEPPGSRAAAGL